MSVIDERRCPNCQALVSADAEWCGQCFASLRATAEREPAPPGAVHVAADVSPTDPGAARWTCPACDHENGLDLDACEVCGTPFATLFHQDEERPPVDPRYALTRSLIFPGLGHRAIGRGPDGLARSVLFLYTFGTSLLILFYLFSGVTSGPIVGLLLLYGSLALTIYAFTALEAYRMAQGSGPIVPARTLLWGVVALILVSVLMAAFVIFSAARS